MIVSLYQSSYKITVDVDKYLSSLIILSLF